MNRARLVACLLLGACHTADADEAAEEFCVIDPINRAVRPSECTSTAHCFSGSTCVSGRCEITTDKVPQSHKQLISGYGVIEMELDPLGEGAFQFRYPADATQVSCALFSDIPVVEEIEGGHFTHDRRTVTNQVASRVAKFDFMTIRPLEFEDFSINELESARETQPADEDCGGEHDGMWLSEYRAFGAWVACWAYNNDSLTHASQIEPVDYSHVGKHLTLIPAAACGDASACQPFEECGPHLAGYNGCVMDDAVPSPLASPIGVCERGECVRWCMLSRSEDELSTGCPPPCDSESPCCDQNQDYCAGIEEVDGSLMDDWMGVCRYGAQLTAHYNFDEEEFIEGESEDFCKYESAAEITNTNYGAGWTGNGLACTSTPGSTIDLPASILDGLDEYTIELYVNPQSPFGGCILCRGDDPAAGDMVWLTLTQDPSPRVRFAQNGDVGITSDVALELGEWAHVVATYDGSSMELFVNRESQGRLEQPFVNSPASGMAACSSPGGGNHADMALDELRFADGVLTEEQWLPMPE